MDLPVIPMSNEEFHLMPHRLGWKHEYWDDAARLSPSHAVMLAILPLRKVGNDVSNHSTNIIKPLPDECDQAEFRQLFADAFFDTIEYCGWPQKDKTEAAYKSIERFFAGKDGPINPASRIAVTQDGALVGAMLISDAEPSDYNFRDIPGPMQQMLMIAPQHQRQGLACAMLAGAVATLRNLDQRILRSMYVLGNEPSRSWHRRMGFEERPDYLTAGHLVQHERWNLDRAVKLGEITPELEEMWRKLITTMADQRQMLEDISMERFQRARDAEN